MPKREQHEDLTTAAQVLQKGTWTAAEVAALLDVPEAIAMRWAQTGIVRGCTYSQGQWRLPGRGLFFFLQGRLEQHYRVKTAAALLDVSERTLEGWIKAGRLLVRKLGTASASTVLVPESALLALLKAERRAA
jgi:excisionase family DNA binding protein